ncbi:hypothetical protein [Methylobacterium sp. 17Sr1-1]|uniref:hypothetical protein n=1 Tax=Methylobacterium sp. 17Sr1-1 TaxID=2202826 RepID=UPI000D6F3A5F|nr:hypothetical protein [Methylobacterium sp. 17Sr1-1]AWN51594.1 hypothetical protein DK412_07725 [Methylobacterium sp. 17Sr1-1]
MAEPETGERTATITTRQDDRAWPDVERALREGGRLFRPARLRDCYVQMPDPSHPLHHMRSLSASRVKRLVADGVLRKTGADTYALAAPGPLFSQERP